MASYYNYPSANSSTTYNCSLPSPHCAQYSTNQNNNMLEHDPHYFLSDSQMYNKCYDARHVLQENWLMLYSSQEFMELVDNEKLKELPIYQFSLILKSSQILDCEKNILKKRRQQSKKNATTEVLRKKYKEQEHQLEIHIDSLVLEKQLLQEEKEILTQEIASYKNSI